jgi:cytochrome c-type biogenesis protein CcmH/NrfG
LIETQKRADEAYQKEDWKTAEKEYLYLAQNFPGEIEPWFRLGNIYARTGQLDAAVSAYREALVRDTKNGKAWHNLGIVQLRQATNTFVEMLAYTDPNDPLNQRAKQIVDAMDDLMAKRLGVEVPE